MVAGGRDPSKASFPPKLMSSGVGMKATSRAERAPRGSRAATRHLLLLSSDKTKPGTSHLVLGDQLFTL